MSVELRKTKKDDMLAKRRNVVADEDESGPLSPKQENQQTPQLLPIGRHSGGDQQQGRSASAPSHHVCQENSQSGKKSSN